MITGADEPEYVILYSALLLRERKYKLPSVPVRMATGLPAILLAKVVLVAVVPLSVSMLIQFPQ